MRVRGLGENGRLGAAVLILATWILACLALIAGWRYADAAEVCVSRETFTQIQIALGHPMGKMKITRGVVDAAVAFNNENAPKAIEADDLSFFLFSAELQMIKLVFWKNGCYVEDGLINFAALAQLMKAGGPEI